MPKKLVIVESPTKARTITRFLDRDTHVMASMGHVRDLPDGDFGVDIAHGFKPTYRMTSSGKRTMGGLAKAAGAASDIYLATDPDREGEAIAWHLREILSPKTQAAFHRVTFHEITQSAIRRAFEHATQVDMALVDAQQARRILDRLVGYKVSPLLWKSIKRGTSAGRVQSVALRLIVERERDIRAFEPQEYWTMLASFRPEQPPTPFEARLFKLDGEKPQIPNAEMAEALAKELEQAAFEIVDTRTRPKKQRPAPPFITSTLQQAAGGRLRFSTRQTMQVAQQLYEGVELGSEGATGLITYMRTDSVSVAKEAQDSARTFIGEHFGPDYVPEKPNRYRSRQSAQEAHEAIRPSDVNRTPDAMAPHLDTRQLKLYTLIWNRFVASQMTPAQLSEHVIEIKALPGGNGENALAHDYVFRAAATKTVFPGFTRVYGNGAGDGAKAGNGEREYLPLPAVSTGTSCDLLDLQREQKFTEPPKRYSEAALVRELEQNGVGRPSTYAAIVHTIQQRDYVKKEKGSLVPTDLGCSVTDYLVDNMPDLFDVKFTAGMEERLDDIEEGKVGMSEMLEDFYDSFRNWVVDVEVVHAPKPDTCARFLDIFPPDLEWAPPRKRGRQTFDDRKFYESLSNRLKEVGKLTDRQWIAALGLAAKYADALPDLSATLEELDLNEEFAAAKQAENERQRVAARRAERDRQPPSPLALDLIEALRNVDWAPPETRGKRVYDDRSFYESLAERVTCDKPLTSPQEKALVSLFKKYSGQVANFRALAEKHGIETQSDGTDPGNERRLAALLSLFERVEKWHPPRTVRKRTYDDREFAESVKAQFARKKILSDKQVAAVKKMLSRYHEQLPDYGQLQETHGLPPPSDSSKPAKRGQASAPETVDEKCPECGKSLAVRRGKRGPFLGCTGYPKCRFTKEIEGGE